MFWIQNIRFGHRTGQNCFKLLLNTWQFQDFCPVFSTISAAFGVFIERLGPSVARVSAMKGQCAGDYVENF